MRSSDSSSGSSSGSRSESDSDSSTSSLSTRSVASSFSLTSRNSTDRDLKRKIQEVLPQAPPVESKKSKKSHKLDPPIVEEPVKSHKKKSSPSVVIHVPPPVPEPEEKEKSKSHSKSSKDHEHKKDKHSKSRKRSSTTSSIAEKEVGRPSADFECPSTPAATPEAPSEMHFFDDSKSSPCSALISQLDFSSDPKSPQHEDCKSVLTSFFADLSQLCQNASSKLAGCKPENLSTAKKKKAPADPNRPKRPQNAYTIFYASQRAKCVKGEDGSLVSMKEAGAQWHKLSAEDKKPYEESAMKLKAQFSQKLAEYKEKLQ